MRAAPLSVVSNNPPSCQSSSVVQVSHTSPPCSPIHSGCNTAVPILQSRLRSGVNAEREAEQLAVTLLYSGSSLLSQQRDGLVLMGLSGRPTGQLFKSVIWCMAATKARVRQGGGAAGSVSGAGGAASSGLQQAAEGPRSRPAAAVPFELPYHRCGGLGHGLWKHSSRSPPLRRQPCLAHSKPAPA